MGSLDSTEGIEDAKSRRYRYLVLAMFDCIWRLFISIVKIVQ